jgi:low temperature requirement protein LtrA
MAVSGNRSWWQRAALRTDEDSELDRRVSWLELFFDLVFVVVIARLSHDLAQHVDRRGVIEFCLQFMAVFWAWNAFTYYTERFESDGLETRLFTFLAMATVAGLAVWAEDGLGAHYAGFVTAYLLTRAVNMAQWIRAGIHEPRFRPTAARFVAGYVVAAVLALAGLRAGDTVRWVLFAAAVLIEIGTPALTIRLQAALPRLSTSKFPERFGQLTMIVLGESVVGVVTGLSDLNAAHKLDGTRLGQGVLGLCLGFGLWWIYFDFIGRRPPMARFGVALGWVYLHLLALIGITATGAGVSLLIADGAEGPGRKLLGASVAVALIGFGLLELTLARRDDEPSHPVISPLIKVVAGLLATLVILDLGWTATLVLLLLLAVQLVPMIYGLVIWFRPAPGLR